jgi:hypothetical protein
MVVPFVIQPCILNKDKKLVNTLVVSVDSKKTKLLEQIMSWNRIRESSVVTDNVTVTFKGNDVTVYMASGEGFSFTDYKEHVQKLAEGKLKLAGHLTVPYMFEEALSLALNNVEKLKFFAWFDYEENDVLFTLNEDHMMQVTSLLKNEGEVVFGW